MPESSTVDRDWDRISFEEIVRLQPPEGGQCVALSARNLSKGGIFISTLHPHPVGSCFALEFLLDRRKIRVERAEVIWTTASKHEPFKRQGMGCRFLTLPPEAEKYLRERLERLLKSDHLRAAPHFDPEPTKPERSGHWIGGREPGVRQGRDAPFERQEPLRSGRAFVPQGSPRRKVGRTKDGARHRPRLPGRAAAYASRSLWLTLLLFLLVGTLTACLLIVRP